MPNSIKSIGKNAFLNLDNLTQIIIPKSVEDINDNEQAIVRLREVIASSGGNCQY